MSRLFFKKHAVYKEQQIILEPQCAICTDFGGTGNPYYYRRDCIQLRLNWNDFIRSTCPKCEILAQGVRGCFSQHNIVESQILYFSIYLCSPGWGSTEISFCLRDKGLFTVEIFTTAAIPKAWQLIAVKHRTSPRTDSDAALALIQEWLGTCHGASHKLCTSPDEAKLPSRLVDVGLGDGRVRVIELHGRVASYICLSHCWGQVQTITTTKSTLQERMIEIQMQALPNTFRDAILLTRRLGIPYLWIDSLCIIQDDKNDWEIESANMKDIYSMSYLTIAATHSHSGEGGLFRDTPDVEICGTTPYGEEYQIFFREKIDHRFDNEDPTLGSGHPTSFYKPLFTRGWVFQERMLSPRVLHFGHHELFFESRSGLRCECGGIGPPVTTLTKNFYANALEGELDAPQMRYIQRVWRTMVCHYTRLGLTKLSDRLPAISGLAKQLAVRRKSAYLAGLWEDTLNYDLLWSISSGFNTDFHNSTSVPGMSTFKKARPWPRTAPTWSWASVDVGNAARVDIEPHDIVELYTWNRDISPFEHFARVEECRIIPAAVDEYGEITQGYIRISGLVATGKLEKEVRILAGVEGDENLAIEITLHRISFSSGVAFLMEADYLLDEQGPKCIVFG